MHLSPFIFNKQCYRFIYAMLAFALISCSKKDECPPDEILGNLSLDVNSVAYLPYNNIRFLEFVDAGAQNTATLYDPQSLIRDTSRTIVENICIEEEMRADRYYLAEHLTINYYDLDTSRKLRIIGNIGIVEDGLAKTSEPLDPVLYDELKLTVHRTNPSVSGAVASISFVASNRGNTARFSDTLLSKQNRYLLIPSVQINDSVYSDVYEYRNRDSIYFYFKPSVGIVAFRTIDNKWWNLHKKY
ncbi:MAG: hypothetical protein IPM92_10640 [Saprospiraceae bacterium]|nr:hypothetical protein [Saprospiraceae bacterium]